MPASAVVLSTLFFILGWLVPNRYFPWFGFENELPIFVSLVLLGGVFFVKKDSGFFFPRGGLFLTGISIVPILQYACGLVSYFGDAYIVTLYLLAGVLAYGLGYRLEKLDGTARPLLICAWAISFVAVLSVWIALRQCLDLSNSGLESEMDSWSINNRGQTTI